MHSIHIKWSPLVWILQRSMALLPRVGLWSVCLSAHITLGVRLPTTFRFGSMAQAMVRMEHQSAQGSLILHSPVQISPQNTCCGLGGVVAQDFLSLDGQHLMCLDSSSGAVLGYQAWWLDGS